MFRTKEKISYPILSPDDRGKAKYFHGREEILYNFAATLGRADNTNGGTIFLVQGPPGAGKTALFYQCRKQAEAYGWETAEIEPEHLWSPDKLQKNLGLPSSERITGKEREAGATSHVTATMKREITVDNSSLTPSGYSGGRGGAAPANRSPKVGKFSRASC